jgi:hypothetical protein
LLFELLELIVRVPVKLVTEILRERDDALILRTLVWKRRNLRRFFSISGVQLVDGNFDVIDDRGHSLSESQAQEIGARIKIDSRT